MEQFITLMSGFGSLFRVHKNQLCWILWSLANIGWSISFIYKKLPAEDYLFLVYLFLSVYGWAKWINAHNGKSAVGEYPRQEKNEELSGAESA